MQFYITLAHFFSKFKIIYALFRVNEEVPSDLYLDYLAFLMLHRDLDELPVGNLVGTIASFTQVLPPFYRWIPKGPLLLQ